MLLRAVAWLTVVALCAAVAQVVAPRSAETAQLTMRTVPAIELPPPLPNYPDPRAWAERPLCDLSNRAQALVNRTSARIGVAVADLAVGELWIGGDRGTFALHSVAKAPIAWMTLAAAESRGETLTALLADQMRQMISWSSNTAVPLLLDYAGGLSELREFYGSLHLDSLVANFNDHSWGRGRGTPRDVAAAYGQMAASEHFSTAVRERGLALLGGVTAAQRWGGITAPLRGWRTLVKTGQFAIKDEGLRLNSAAIWLDEWRRPRYVVVIMAANQRHYGLTMQRQTEIGEAIAAGVGVRERGAMSAVSAPGTCASAQHLLGGH